MNRQCVCRIEVARVEFDVLRPWQRTAQQQSTGTGFCLRRLGMHTSSSSSSPAPPSSDNVDCDGVILTNAHVVRGAVDIRVRRQGDTKRYAAQVLVRAPDVDLALLILPREDDRRAFFLPANDKDNNNNQRDVNDSNKRRRMSGPLALQLCCTLPALQESVHVVGYPTGGKTICVTEGVVSRIDLAGDRQPQLIIQVDSAINPGNSGGPAFNKHGQVVGVAFGKKVKSSSSTSGSGALKIDNIGYLIPSCVVQGFLQRCAPALVQSQPTGDGPSSSTALPSLPTMQYQLSPTVPYRWHSLENASLRKAHQVPDHVHGILITTVCEQTMQGALCKNDILTHINDQAIADDGQVVLRPGELIQHSYFFSIHKLNDGPIPFGVYRHHEKQPTVLQGHFRGEYIPSILPRWPMVDLSPDYLVLGSLILLPASWPLRAKKTGSKAMGDCIDWDVKWPAEWQGHTGLVILTEIFAHELSFSYRRHWRRVVSYNGEQVRSLAHLRDLWAASCAAVRAKPSPNELKDKNNFSALAFARIQLEHDDDIVFDVEQAMAAQAEILATHCIPQMSHIAPPNSSYKWGTKSLI